MQRPLICLTWMTLILMASPTLAAQRDLKIEGKASAEYLATQSGRSWAVVIGIDEYAQAPRLKYAVADAKAMAELLGRQGFAVTALYNQQASREAILVELSDKLLKKVGEQDRVVIFYAGHGETQKTKGGKEMGYLIPAEGRRNALAASSISMGLIRELADALPSKHVLFLVDVCYGGIAGQQFRSLPPMTEEYLRVITRERGRQLITAGGADQQAMEAPEWGHSVFSHYLLEGLGKGLADLNSDGIVPASELYSYLESRVFSAAQLKGHTQRPELWALAAEKGEFVFTPVKQTLGKTPGPSAALSQAERELKALEAEERRVEEEKKLAAIQKQIEEKKERIEKEKKRPVEVAEVKTYEAPREPDREITGQDGAPMLLIPAGEFMMGSNDGESDEKPVHRVSLPAFYLDKYEVTTERYALFLQATGRKQPVMWDQVSLGNHSDRPVIFADWHDADAYCRYYGKRLPTEAEWEKAARGTDGRKYPWGNEEPTSRHANFNKSCGVLFSGSCKPYSAVLISVGSYEDGKSPYGIYDMAGNAWEWVSSLYKPYPYSASDGRESLAPSGSRVARGGSWNDNSGKLRLAYRRRIVPDLRTDFLLGFRCAQ